MIGRPKPQCDDATRRDLLTANRQVLFGNPKEKRNGGIETDDFFDGGIDQSRIFFQFLQLVRMALLNTGMNSRFLHCYKAA
jgi:hypothetical protein